MKPVSDPAIMPEIVSSSQPSTCQRNREEGDKGDDSIDDADVVVRQSNASHLQGQVWKYETRSCGRTEVSKRFTTSFIARFSSPTRFTRGEVPNTLQASYQR